MTCKITPEMQRFIDGVDLKPPFTFVTPSAYTGLAAIRDAAITLVIIEHDIAHRLGVECVRGPSKPLISHVYTQAHGLHPDTMLL